MTARILIIDDDANLTRVIAYALDVAGFETLVAPTGEEGMKLLRDQHPDLVILDIMLPGMSGIEMCELLRADPTTADTPLIMLSARAQVADMVTGLEAGADEYITKPVDLEEIVARVRSLLKRTNRLRAAEPVAEGTVVSFVGAKGGVGTTTVALSVASLLAHRRKRVVAAEIRPYGGSFAFQLNKRGPANLSALLESEPPYDRQLLSGLLQDTPAGMKVLFGPQEASEFQELGAEKARAIVDALLLEAEFAILDLPAQPSALVRACVAASSAVALVLEPEPGCVAAAKTAIGVFDSWQVTRPTVRAVVVNRAALPVSASVSMIRDALGCDVLGPVPVAPAACVKAQEVGMPIAVYQPESSVAAALSDVAHGLVAYR